MCYDEMSMAELRAALDAHRVTVDEMRHGSSREALEALCIEHGVPPAQSAPRADASGGAASGAEASEEAPPADERTPDERKAALMQRYRDGQISRAQMAKEMQAIMKAATAAAEAAAAEAAEARRRISLSPPKMEGGAEEGDLVLGDEGGDEEGDEGGDEGGDGDLVLADEGEAGGDLMLGDEDIAPSEDTAPSGGGEVDLLGLGASPPPPRPAPLNRHASLDMLFDVPSPDGAALEPTSAPPVPAPAAGAVQRVRPGGVEMLVDLAGDSAEPQPPSPAAPPPPGGGAPLLDFDDIGVITPELNTNPVTSAPLFDFGEPPVDLGAGDASSPPPMQHRTSLLD